MAGRQGTICPAVGDQTPDATLVGADGEPRALRDLWEGASRGAAVVFLRQFG